MFAHTLQLEQDFAKWEMLQCPSLSQQLQRTQHLFGFGGPCTTFTDSLGSKHQYWSSRGGVDDLSDGGRVCVPILLCMRRRTTSTDYNRRGIIASIVRTIVFAQTLEEAGPLTDSTCKSIFSIIFSVSQLTWTPDNHVTLINWNIIEPGIYLLSGCALSFKPLLRMFSTQTKTTFPSGKSRTNTKAATYTDIHLKSIPVTGGKFYRMSEDSDKGGETRTMEVRVTTTVDVETKNGRFDGRREEFEKSNLGTV
jgi:hypothetical protein